MSDSPYQANFAPRLLKQISDKQIDPEQLTPHQRRICVRSLLEEEKYTQNEIAAILHVNFRVISKDAKKIEEQNAWMFDVMVNEPQLIVRTILSAKNKAARLCRQGKYKEAWTVEKECIELLQTLGYVKKKPMELDFKAEYTLVELLKLAADSDRKDETNILGKEGRNLQALTNGT